MKKKSKKDDNISRYIFDEYIFNKDLTPLGDELRQYDLLVENNLATVIKTEGYSYLNMLTEHNILVYFICQYNKRIKDRLIPQSDNILYPETSEKIKKMRKYILGEGKYYAELKNDNFLVLSVKNKLDEDNYNMVSTVLYIIGRDHLKYRDKFFKFKDECKKLSKENNKMTRIIYLGTQKPAKEVKFKSFDQYVYKNKKELISYVDQWVNNIPIYYNKYHMIPRLSFLLYGKPGTGKTTFYQVLANYLGIDAICSIDPQFFSGNSRNMYLSNTLPRIYTIDEIDMFCQSRENNNDNLENGRILSSLLAFLDAPDTFYFKAKDGIHYPVSIVVATTNYYDRLDEAVKRFGRFDKKIEMKYFTQKEAEEMCQLYELTLADVIDEPINEDFTISPSELQTRCLENIDKALKNNKKGS